MSPTEAKAFGQLNSKLLGASSVSLADAEALEDGFYYVVDKHRHLADGLFGCVPASLLDPVVGHFDFEPAERPGPYIG